MLRNPKDTIDFDYELDEAIRQRRDNLGADGALLTTSGGNIYTVNFMEKLLATVLAKLSGCPCQSPKCVRGPDPSLVDEGLLSFLDT